MTILAQEARNVQNPALGAGLLWRFTCGYIEAHRTAEGAPLQLLFIVLPILFHGQTEEFLNRTQRASGLRAFAVKFGDSKASKQDLLLTIHDRTLQYRSLSKQSLQLALATRLIHLETNGKVIPLSRTQAVAGMPDETRLLMRDAEKLGHWCSQVTLHEVAAILKVRF
jgi:hypothetical protein